MNVFTNCYYRLQEVRYDSYVGRVLSTQHKCSPPAFPKAWLPCPLGDKHALSAGSAIKHAH